jgi:D-arabinose 1-dehydrogenase-like Zn-dependent alcohol dehydrogenase
MKTKILHSYGNNEISEYDYDLGPMQPNQMLIKSIYTGICRSDIEQYLGHIAIPFGHFGHESLGEVIEVGEDVLDFYVGDIVASRNDPAFSQYFYADDKNTVRVPEAHPRYIIEPVACSVNIAESIVKNGNLSHDILFVGSGFIANIVAQYIRQQYPNLKIYVVGQHNRNEWESLHATFITFDEIKTRNKRFKTIVELSGKSENFDNVMSVAATSAFICLAASFDKPITTTFWRQLWNDYTIAFPSPRNDKFNTYMKTASLSIYLNYINVDWVWTHAYDAHDFKQAFAESVERNTNERFVRSYLKW